MTPPKRLPTERGLARRKLGVDGELAVAIWYERRGYEIVDRNWRCREGEIDLILRDSRTLVFCEVKTRSSTRFGLPVEAVTMAKQRRLRTLAIRWLSENPGKGAMRFDVASVMNGDITVIENAF